MGEYLKLVITNMAMMWELDVMCDKREVYTSYT